MTDGTREPDGREKSEDQKRGEMVIGCLTLVTVLLLAALVWSGIVWLIVCLWASILGMGS